MLEDFPLPGYPAAPRAVPAVPPATVDGSTPKRKVDGSGIFSCFRALCLVSIRDAGTESAPGHGVPIEPHGGAEISMTNPPWHDTYPNYFDREAPSKVATEREHQASNPAAIWWRIDPAPGCDTDEPFYAEAVSSGAAIRVLDAERPGMGAFYFWPILGSPPAECCQCGETTEVCCSQAGHSNGTFDEPVCRACCTCRN